MLELPMSMLEVSVISVVKKIIPWHVSLAQETQINCFGNCLFHTSLYFESSPNYSPWVRSLEVLFSSTYLSSHPPSTSNTLWELWLQEATAWKLLFCKQYWEQKLHAVSKGIFFFFQNDLELSRKKNGMGVSLGFWMNHFFCTLEERLGLVNKELWDIYPHSYTVILIWVLRCTNRTFRIILKFIIVPHNMKRVIEDFFWNSQ